MRRGFLYKAQFMRICGTERLKKPRLEQVKKIKVIEKVSFWESVQQSSCSSGIYLMQYEGN